jgi:drug/metabolite transporter (DMT)-like permease
VPVTPPTRGRIIAGFLVLYLVWGSTYLFIKWMVADIPPFLAAALRHGAAGVTLYLWARSQGAPRPTRREWGVAALVGTLLLAGGNGMVNWASQRIPTGLSALLVSSVPVWMVIVDWARPHGVRPARGTIVGLFLGTLGVAGLVWGAGGIGQTPAQTAAVVLTCIALLAGSLSWATGSILSRQLPRQRHGLLASGMEMTAASVLLLPISFAVGEFARFSPAAVSPLAWGALAYLTIAGSLLGFTTYNSLLRVSPPATVATYAYVNPVVAVGLGWAILGERLTPMTMGAAAVILAAVAAITLTPRRALR